MRAWPLSGGISAGMSAVELHLANGLVRRMVVRRPGAAALRLNPRAAADEYRLLRRLHSAGLAVPEPLLLDESGTIFPTPYLVMAFIEGRPEFAPADPADTAGRLAAQLAAIHRVQLEAEEQALLPSPVGHLPALPVAVDPAFDVTRVLAVLKGVWPVPRHNQPALLHGDYWPGNILWQGGRLAAVVDWEDAAYGEPLVDVAIARLDLLWIYGQEAMQRFSEQYFAQISLDTRSLPYWDLYAALRLARLAGADLEGWASFFHPYGRTDITAESIRTFYRKVIDQAFDQIEK